MAPKDDRLYPQRPFVAVAAVVWKGDDQVLLVSRGTEPRLGEWGLPGGAQELNETAIEAVKREVLEETAVEIDVLGVVDVVDSIHADDDGRVRLHYTIVEFCAEWRSGEVRAGEDAARAQWFTLEEALQAVRWPKTAEIIRKAADLRKAQTK
jgi:ADP-ribose pyrophosphatase YjhB (NUDIX family)